MTTPRLTEKEKDELRKLLEDQDKIGDTSWLMVDHYAKLSKKENPNDLGCKLCMKTHFPKNCPNRKSTKDKGDSEYIGFKHSQYSYGEYD